VRRLALRAPAKLNLGLRVTGRRADGYHELVSVFVPLGLADALRLELGGPPGIRLTLGGEAAAGVPGDERNLAWRAAQAFLRTAGRAEEGVSLALDKRVPSPAGLGGGSSDAGAVLRGLAALLPGTLSRADLADLALRLGADVPFFLAPRPALVTGIGERILPLSGLGALPVLLAHPGVGLETRAVYAALDAGSSLTPPTPPPTFRALLGLREEAGAARAQWPGTPSQLRELVGNDLEPAASRLSDQVAKLREELTATGARAVGMSGSGPTLYAIYASDAEVAEAARGVARPGLRTWQTHTLASDAADELEPRTEEGSDRASE
jgi:4-diphosphocytidyl-2-C-methyl-D-erythritol kinase